MTQDYKTSVQLESEIISRLEPIAQSRGITLDHLVYEILENYVQQSPLLSESKQERRKHKRKPVQIPAMVYEQSHQENIGRYFSATILDFSLEGSRVAFPLTVQGKLDFLQESSHFELICMIPDSEGLSRFKCQPIYSMKKDQTLQVGNRFEGNPDNNIRKQLTKFL